MKPSEHPEFYRLAPPEGRSRESTIRLDKEGHFFHDDAPVEHPKLRDAMHTWIKRHPDDGRYILDNGYDWTYFTVEDAPFLVQHLSVASGEPKMVLSDGSEEAFSGSITERSDGTLLTEVKRGVKGGPFQAKFSRHAQTELAPFLEARSEGVALRLPGREITILPEKKG